MLTRYYDTNNPVHFKRMSYLILLLNKIDLCDTHNDATFYFLNLIAWFETLNIVCKQEISNIMVYTKQ